MSNIVRTRQKGNFLWDIYSNALPYKQLEFKDKLLKKSDGNPFKLWQSFNRIQTDEEKSDNFNAQIIGEMVQVFCEIEIKQKLDLTDLEKLELKHKKLIEQQKQTKLPLWKQ